MAFCFELSGTGLGVVRWMEKHGHQSGRFIDLACIERVPVAGEANGVLDVMHVALVVSRLIFELLADRGMDVHAFNLAVSVGKECECHEPASRKDARDCLIGDTVNLDKQMFAAVKVARRQLCVFAIDCLMSSNLHIAFRCIEFLLDSMETVHSKVWVKMKTGAQFRAGRRPIGQWMAVDEGRQRSGG